MRFHIDIDLCLSTRLKRVLVVGLPVGLLLASSIVYGSVPNTFKDGDTLSAQAMNDNFVSLDSRLSMLEQLANRQTHDGGYSLNATFCGASTSTTAGDMSGLPVTGTGYAKAKAQCTLTCASPSAHFCAANEIGRSNQLGVTVPTGWYESSTYEVDVSKPNYECFGWSSKLSAVLGPQWVNDAAHGSAPSDTTCDQLAPILCCD
jgi:hypothetical protein